MALVMIVVELFMALLAAATEFVAPLAVTVAELLFSVVLIVIELVVALFSRRKVKVPTRPEFTGARSGLRSFAIKIREKRARRKNKS